MMKIRKASVIALIAALGLSLSACGDKVDNEESQQQAGNTEKSDDLEASETAAISDVNATDIDIATAVEDAYAKETTINIDDAESLEVSYHIPKIRLDMPGATAINSQIDKDFEEIVEISDDMDYYPNWFEVSWEANLNNDILSLIVIKRSTMDDYTVANSYNLDLTSKNQLSNTQLLEKLGISQEEYLDKLRVAAAYEVDRGFEAFFNSDYMVNEMDIESKQRMHGEFLRLRAETISKDNIRLDLPLYLDENGKITTVTEIGVMAGGGIYEKALNMREDSKAKDFELSFRDAMFIEYKQGMMTIRIEKNDWSSQYFADAEIDFGKIYPVHGLFKDYIEGCIVEGENEDIAIPAFLSDDGLVASLDLYKCAQGGYFVLNEPVYNACNVSALANNPTAFDAVRANQQMVFSEFAQNMMGLYCGDGVSYNKQVSDSTGNHNRDYYMGFNMANPWEFLYQDSVFDEEIYICYSGSCSYIGMDENGPVFNYHLSNVEDNNDKKQGLFSAFRKNKWIPESEEWLDWVDYTHIGGSILFDEDGTNISLGLSQG